jgi:hypothetical protein
MKNKLFNIVMLVASLLLAKAAQAQGQIEVMCRNKAKEIALSAYQGCVTEEKTTRLKALKDRYKSKMSEVKGEFQRELDEINGKSSSGATNKDDQITLKPEVSSTSLNTRPSRAKRTQTKGEKPVSGVAKSLPAKMNNSGPALPMQNEYENTPVVTETASQEATPEPEIVEIAE